MIRNLEIRALCLTVKVATGSGTTVQVMKRDVISSVACTLYLVLVLQNSLKITNFNRTIIHVR